MLKLMSIEKVLVPIIFLIVILFVVVKGFLSINNRIYKKIALIDVMTGLKNRNAFERFLLELSWRKFPQTVGIAVMDLNNLKTVNNTFGHMAGEKLVISVAELLKQIKDIKTNIFRIGNEEFVCVISGDIEEFDLPKRIMEEITNYNKIAKIKISFAMGYSQNLIIKEKSYKQIIELFKIAEARMHNSKARMNEEMSDK